MLGIIFKAAVKAVLLFGLETWVINHQISWDLGISRIGWLDIS